ncbi:hypothetical protein MVES_003283 [Malassezia vespertilionis]|uniref:Large ribosomal subunit protein uL23m n=2 Tax=Malassezia vespertilionis TaxID=2020962 RepID=A0A2N1J8N5_9BASI|nr:hypothetical protein MVES_003283 [Malassezia vespertilionis]
MRAPITPARARQFLRWQWLSAEQRDELATYVAAAQSGDVVPPAWLAAELEAARSYRTARARGWEPTAAQLQRAAQAESLDAFLLDAGDALRAKLERGERARVELGDWDTMDVDEQADILLQPVWQSLSDDERAEALVRVAFACMRKMGWRTGYSAGFPGDGALPVPMPGADASERAAHWRALLQSEEERAWDAWKLLSPDARRAEWATAWQQRDRSVVYLDDAPTTKLLGAVAPRWYAVPQRAGKLQFLPNMTARLVRNYTPRGEPYDAWKATFRVPLHVHKHVLRSYLLAVYGLRTTWARSMVYRSRITYSVQKKRRAVGRGRTFKKVEVGLLEPFVFPSISKEFLRTHLFQQEMMFEERRLMLKMTKAQRWRGTKSVQDLSASLDRDYAAQNAGAPDEAPGAKPTAQLLVRSGSVPTARHNNILSVLSERRAKRNARVQAYIKAQETAAS